MLEGARGLDPMARWASERRIEGVEDDGGRREGLNPQPSPLPPLAGRGRVRGSGE